MIADESGVARSRLSEGRGGLGRMVVAWLGGREGLHRLQTIADALGLRSLGRVSDLAREAEGTMRGDTAFAAACAAMHAQLA